MAYEEGSALRVAESEDGLHWGAGTHILEGPPQTQYGSVAQRAPTILYWGPEGEDPQYHIWFEAIAEVGSDTLPGVTPSAIVHATSGDGLLWNEAEGGISIALRGVTDNELDETPEWRHEVGEPSVAVLSDERLAMWFVGRNPTTGTSAIGVQTSSDGQEWTTWLEPVSFEPAGPMAFERDGIANPTVVARDGVLHMWYDGVSASRRSIGYAVGADLARWHRFGPVLEGSEPWEKRRVGGPSVVAVSREGGVVDLSLYYHAGTPGHEGIGLAYREVPLLESFDF
jgi:hypothetical protein